MINECLRTRVPSVACLGQADVSEPSVFSRAAGMGRCHSAPGWERQRPARTNKYCWPSARLH